MGRPHESRKFFQQSLDALCTYALQLGWLHTKDKGADKTRGQIAGSSIKMPPVPDRVLHLPMLWAELGRCAGWIELRNWQEATATPLTIWESNALMRMCETYKSAVSEYNGVNKPAPWTGEIDRERVAKDVRAAIRGR